MSIADRLDETKIRYVDVDGIRTRCYEDGAGEPLVLIHGGEYSSYYSLDSWSLNLPELAESFHVYALDKLGHGYTDNPPGDEYTWEALARHTYGFFRALRIEGAHVAGHSRGGLSAAYLALEHPELVKRTIVVDSSTLAPEDPQHPSGHFYRELDRRLRPGATLRERVLSEPEAQAYNRGQVTEDFVARMSQIADLPKVREARRRMKALSQSVWFPSLNRARVEALGRIDESGLPVPVLVVWGFNDRAAPVALAHRLFERLCARTPQAELHVLNRAGHYSFREQPAAFNRIVRSFCLA